MPSPDLTQLSAIAIIFIFFVKEFFSFLKGKKNGNGNDKILFELQKMNDNHLHSIQNAIEDGNRRHLESQNETSRQIIQLLGEIKGALSR